MIKFKELLSNLSEIFTKYSNSNNVSIKYDDENPLIVAVRNSDLKLINTLLDSNVNMHVMDNEMHTPFRYCVKYNNLNIKNLLINKADTKDLKRFQEQISNNIEMLEVPEHIRLYFLSELDKNKLKLDLETEFSAREFKKKF